MIRVKPKQIATALLAWFDQHGRKNLPWQRHKTPYRVWVSEIMLQQTQVSTVIPAFKRFMQHFPDITALATAAEDSVLHLWSGLGYYSRARNLHRSARCIIHDFQGRFPDNRQMLETLPGIGRSTAGAILAIAFNQKTAILDGNVKRVLTRLYGITTWPGEKNTEKTLWELAEAMTPSERTADYTQAIMDLGATVCTRSKPHCMTCPLIRLCHAYKQNLTTQIPQKKPAKKIPTRRIIFLVLQQNKTILLEKRPANGIWGGLWGFPEMPAETDHQTILAFCKNELHFHATRITSLPAFRHTFSHFHLDIQPILIEKNTTRLPQRSLTKNHIWYTGAASQKVGLPTPIKKILDTLLCPASSTVIN